jgi:microsomal dipeptidase-like Zn-dependent dipeptidase
MSSRRLYVDTLGFLGDVGPPMFDDRTKKNARDSGVRLFVMTTTWPMQNWKVTIQMHRQTVQSLNQHQDTFHIVRNTVDLQKVLDKDMIGVILGMQDPGCIGDRFERIHQLYEEGIRVMQVAYQKKNHRHRTPVCRGGQSRRNHPGSFSPIPRHRSGQHKIIRGSDNH